MSCGVWLDGEEIAPGSHRVFLDGRDISRDCWSVDRRSGTVKLFVRDADGRFVLRRGDIKTRKIRGIVPRRLRIVRAPERDSP